MQAEQDQSDYPFDTPPYPLWWDYLNGAVVAVACFALAAAVLTWMVGITLTTFR